MTATEVPPDLAGWRTDAMATTGLQGDEVGVAPDESHKRNGGYHCGVQDIINIGRYPDDYSTRQLPDRVGGNVASACDLGDNWPRGGGAAWLRYNNELVRLLRAGDPRLAGLRAVNFSPDGVACRRYDTLHPEAGVIPSADSVYMHTHHERWRDRRSTAWLGFTVRLMRWAIDGTPYNDEEDDMGASWPAMAIEIDEPTSVTLVETEGGGADPRAQWVRLCNDTGGRAGQSAAPDYALRVMACNGTGGWGAVFATEVMKFHSGVLYSAQLKAGVTGLSFQRAAINAGGTPIDPSRSSTLPGAATMYAGSLTFVIERGPVVRH